MGLCQYGTYLLNFVRLLDKVYSALLNTTDGNINKFTKGASDTFAITGLETALSGPTKIYTNASDDNIYVLDNGNSRIVVFDKTGKYKNQYQAGIIKTAKDFDVLEKDKKIYVLSDGKIYEVDLK